MKRPSFSMLVPISDKLGCPQREAFLTVKKSPLLESDVRDLKIKFLKPPRLRPLLFLWFCSMPEECRCLGTFNCWRFLGSHFFRLWRSVETTNNQMMSLWLTICDNDSYKKGKDTIIKITMMSQSKSDIGQHLLVVWLWCFSFWKI